LLVKANTFSIITQSNANMLFKVVESDRF